MCIRDRYLNDRVALTVGQLFRRYERAVSVGIESVNGCRGRIGLSLIHISDNNRISAAPTVFVFQKIGVFLCGQAFFKLLIDTELSRFSEDISASNSISLRLISLFSLTRE